MTGVIPAAVAAALVFDCRHRTDSRGRRPDMRITDALYGEHGSSTPEACGWTAVGGASTGAGQDAGTAGSVAGTSAGVGRMPGASSVSS